MNEAEEIAARLAAASQMFPLEIDGFASRAYVLAEGEAISVVVANRKGHVVREYRLEVQLVASVVPQQPADGGGAP